PRTRYRSHGDEVRMKPNAGSGAPASDWLSRFHRGDRETFETLYRDHFATVDGAVARSVRGVDRENVVHDVFYHLMTNAEAREGFHGGSIDAWLSTLARNRAIDYLRRQRREEPVGADPAELVGDVASQSFDRRTEARMLLQQFRETVVPAKWRSVFDAR